MSVIKFCLALMGVCAFSIIQSVQALHQEPNVQPLIRDLHNNRWEGPWPISIPLQWDLMLTEPMRKILEVGSPAQQDLINNINDSSITDQVIILLGGVGDERAIGPILNAMIAQKDVKSTPNWEQINLAANIALTNITVADVIWHHGGGVVRVDPPKDSKERWMKWRKKNPYFAVRNITQSRNYSNYPNYGIYKQQ